MAPNNGNTQNGKRKADRAANGPAAKRQKSHAARNIHTQSTASLLKNGSVSDSLNLSTFLSTREFEIKALEDGMRRAKKDLSLRAFQSVPRDMRRRTASHNVKKVPARLRKQATREMKDDNAPTAIKHKVGSRARIRMETAKKLHVLAGLEKKSSVEAQPSNATAKDDSSSGQSVIGRLPVPKIIKNTLKPPPKPVSKFKKRQVHKTWLPTHLWHAKRAKMTDPKSPLWRFAIPLSPTEKSYRPTHRAGSARGAVAWDMSYMSTIGCNGADEALERVLRAVGIVDARPWGSAGTKWRDGKRTWSGWTRRQIGGRWKDIGPATVIWEANPIEEIQEKADSNLADQGKRKESDSKRHVLIRIHPSAFLELWTEILRVSKLQRPLVLVEDLRFDIGSIEITGPNAMEALVGTLKQCNDNDAHGQLFNSLAGLTNASSLPPNALFALEVRDPRLYYPPQKVQLPDVQDSEATFSLLETIAKWNIDNTTPSSTFFNHRSRWDGTRLPSQKAINRRKGAAPPGEYPAVMDRDPSIPIIIYASRGAIGTSTQGSFTLLAPWKCVQPIWYVLMHYPLSIGGNPRLGGLHELQQLCFEHGRAHFPVDYPGTDAGWMHELEERKRRKKEWEARPRGKRTCFESLDLGRGRKGELGNPWACDFEKLLSTSSVPEPILNNDKQAVVSDTPVLSPFSYMTKNEFQARLSSNDKIIEVSNQLLTVKITLLTKGTPSAGARIYKLPAAPPTTTTTQDETTLNESAISTVTQNSTSSQVMPGDLRDQWLSHVLASKVPSQSITKPTTKTLHSKYTTHGLRHVPNKRSVPQTLQDRKIALAQSLLAEAVLPFPRPSNNDASRGLDEALHPPVPNEEDLIGFMTTGNFNLALGKGTGIGSLVAARLFDAEEGLKGKGIERFLCVVRNVGETVGRLGRWEVVWE